MKKTIFTLLLISTILTYGQEVEMSETLKIYEYTHVKEFDAGIDSRLELFEEKMQELNYSGTEKSDDGIKGENFFTKMIMGSAMEVHYNALIKFKDGRYKLTINNFRIKDERYGTVAVETLRKGAQKKWVKFINEKLPQVVANLENTDKW
tara:strand:- start:636 stop:1085 length:450 start_codon:yes stop_codon:yes gene_type:complete